MNPPTDIDIKKDRGVTIRWADGGTAFYSVAYLRRMSPSAEARDLREQIERNPLTIVRSGPAPSGPLVILEAELRGNYALWLKFSDGHATGIYSWEYLKDIQPPAAEA